MTCYITRHTRPLLHEAVCTALEFGDCKLMTPDVYLPMSPDETIQVENYLQEIRDREGCPVYEVEKWLCGREPCSIPDLATALEMPPYSSPHLLALILHGARNGDL
jgi:hypothetical protein